MEYDPKARDRTELTVPCPCRHPSHGADGCRRPMHVGEAKCVACKDHIEGSQTP
jgi:hypothetical protein